MPKKKDRKPAKSSEDDTLNKRIDAMMDPKLPDPTPTDVDNAPSLDIFKDVPPNLSKATKTAPEVSGKLLGKVDTESIDRPTPQPAEPLTSPKETPSEKLAPKLEKQPEPVTKSNLVDKPEITDELASKKTMNLDDRTTDRAVNDIAAKEADTMLALQDAVGRKASHLAGDLAQQDRQRARKKRWLWFVFIVVVITLFLLAVPHIPYTCRWPVGIRLRLTTDILPSVCK